MGNYKGSRKLSGLKIKTENKSVHFKIKTKIYERDGIYYRKCPNCGSEIKVKKDHVDIIIFMKSSITYRCPSNSKNKGCNIKYSVIN